MLSLNLDDKPPIRLPEVNEDDAKSVRRSPWRIASITSAWLLTAIILVLDFYATAGWAALIAAGTMSQGSTEALPDVIPTVLQIKAEIWLVLSVLVALLVWRVRPPRGLIVAWAVTGAAFCSLMSTFIIAL